MFVPRRFCVYPPPLLASYFFSANPECLRRGAIAHVAKSFSSPTYTAFARKSFVSPTYAKTGGWGVTIFRVSSFFSQLTPLFATLTGKQGVGGSNQLLNTQSPK